MSGFRTVVIDDEDTNIVLTPAAKWFIEAWGDEFKEQGSYSYSDALKAQISFTFPMAAVSFSYFGQPECCTGLYDLCVDCDPLDTTVSWKTIDAFVSGAFEDDSPILLYTQSFDTPGLHTVIIRGKGSEITIDRMELQVLDPSSIPVSTPATTSSSSMIKIPINSTIITTVSVTVTSKSTPTLTSSSAITSPLSTPSLPLSGPSAAGPSQPEEPTTTLSTSHRSLPSSHQPASTTASASVTAKPHSTNSKISAAAIAGITVGSFVAIVGLILILLRLRRGQKSSYENLVTPFTPPQMKSSINSLRGAAVSSHHMEQVTNGIYPPSETSLPLGVLETQPIHARKTNGRNYDDMDNQSNGAISLSNIDKYSTTDSMNSHNVLRVAYA